MRNQKRILFFVHDGSGLGHLRRIGRIASELQGPCACLVVSGMRQASWIVPNSCEVLQLPNWNGFSASRSKYWNRPVWLNVQQNEAKRIRSVLLSAAVRAFAPDAIVVDYLPFGIRNELKGVLAQTHAKKYLILRGLIDASDYDILCGKASKDIAKMYDAILVTADSRIVDVGNEYSFEDMALSKLRYVGYVMPEPADRLVVRRDRGIPEGKPWVVCSGGGGMNAELYLRECIVVASGMPAFEFDIVFGPLANESLTCDLEIPKNCRVHSESMCMPELHSSCDVVITAGGYNSIMEAASGGAKIIVYSNQKGTDDEQRNNAERMAAYYPIKLITDITSFQDEIPSAVRDFATQPQSRLSLNTDGLKIIREYVLRELLI